MRGQGHVPPLRSLSEPTPTSLLCRSLSSQSDSRLKSPVSLQVERDLLGNYTDYLNQSKSTTVGVSSSSS